MIVIHWKQHRNYWYYYTTIYIRCQEESILTQNAAVSEPLLKQGKKQQAHRSEPENRIIRKIVLLWREKSPVIH